MAGGMEGQRQLIPFGLDFKGGADKFGDRPAIEGTKEGLRATPVAFCPEQVKPGGFWAGAGTAPEEKPLHDDELVTFSVWESV